MIITVESPSGKRKWRLEPADNGLSWHLLKSSLENKDAWIDCRSYYPTLAGALEQLVEAMLHDPDDKVQLEFSAADVKSAAMRVLKNYLKEVGITIDKED